MNGIDLILADHRRVDALFADFATTQDGTLVGQILDALAAHDAAEQAALYPMAAHVVDDVHVVSQAFAAHSQLKAAMERVRCAEGAALSVVVEALRQMVAEHVADEEAHLLPAIADRATAAQLDGLAARIGQAKQRVG